MFTVNGKNYKNYSDYLKNVETSESCAAQTEFEASVAESTTALIKDLIELREKKGKTQNELAEMCHISKTSLARIESETSSLKVDTLLRILSTLGYTLEIVPNK